MSLTDDDLQELEIFIMKNPNAGDIMQGTGGAIKLRFALPYRGKSGSVIVIYIDLLKAEKVYFLTCYPKSKQDNLSDNEKTAIKDVVKRIIKNEREGL